MGGESFFVLFMSKQAHAGHPGSIEVRREALYRSVLRIYFKLRDFSFFLLIRRRSNFESADEVDNYRLVEIFSSEGARPAPVDEYECWGCCTQCALKNTRHASDGVVV